MRKSRPAWRGDGEPLPGEVIFSPAHPPPSSVCSRQLWCPAAAPSGRARSPAPSFLLCELWNLGPCRLRSPAPPPPPPPPPPPQRFPVMPRRFPEAALEKAGPLSRGIDRTRRSSARGRRPGDRTSKRKYNTGTEPNKKKGPIYHLGQEMRKKSFRLRAASAARAPVCAPDLAWGGWAPHPPATAAQPPPVKTLPRLHFFQSQKFDLLF